jgi:hypothetical protein
MEKGTATFPEAQVMTSGVEVAVPFSFLVYRRSLGVKKI